MGTQTSAYGATTPRVVPEAARTTQTSVSGDARGRGTSGTVSNFQEKELLHNQNLDNLQHHHQLLAEAEEVEQKGKASICTSNLCLLHMQWKLLA
jgi:hypothetical protein